MFRRKDAGIFTEVLSLLLIKCSAMWRRQLLGVDKNMLLPVDGSVQEALLSNPKHRTMMLDTKCFQWGLFGLVIRLWYYYGSLIYSDLGVLSQCLKWYRIGVTRVTVDRISLFANEPLERFRKTMGRSEHSG